MLIVQIKEGDNIEKALKKYKKKFEKTKIFTKMQLNGKDMKCDVSYEGCDIWMER